MNHELKTVTRYFGAIADGRKTFEIRINDRNFQVGDTLTLREWHVGEFTGSTITKTVRYITDFEQKPGYVVMAIA